MPITSSVDRMYLGVQSSGGGGAQEGSPTAQTVKLLLSYLQMLVLLRNVDLPLPSYLRYLFSAAESGSTLKPNFSFFSCEIGNTPLPSLIAVLVATLMVWMVCGFASLARAWYVARRLVDISHTMLMIEHSIMHPANCERLEAYITREEDPAHVEEVRKVHNELSERGLASVASSSFMFGHSWSACNQPIISNQHSSEAHEFDVLDEVDRTSQRKMRAGFVDKVTQE